MQKIFVLALSLSWYCTVYRGDTLATSLTKGVEGVYDDSPEILFSRIPGKIRLNALKILKTFQNEWSKTKSRRTVYPFWASVRRI